MPLPIYLGRKGGKVRHQRIVFTHIKTTGTRVRTVCKHVCTVQIASCVNNIRLRAANVHAYYNGLATTFSESFTLENPKSARVNGQISVILSRKVNQHYLFRLWEKSQRVKR